MHYSFATQFWHVILDAFGWSITHSNNIKDILDSFLVGHPFEGCKKIISGFFRTPPPLLLLSGTLFYPLFSIGAKLGTLLRTIVSPFLFLIGFIFVTPLGVWGFPYFILSIKCFYLKNKKETSRDHNCPTKQKQTIHGVHNRMHNKTATSVQEQD